MHAEESVGLRLQDLDPGFPNRIWSATLSIGRAAKCTQQRPFLHMQNGCSWGWGVLRCFLSCPLLLGFLHLVCQGCYTFSKSWPLALTPVAAGYPAHNPYVHEPTYLLTSFLHIPVYCTKVHPVLFMLLVFWSLGVAGYSCQKWLRCAMRLALVHVSHVLLHPMCPSDHEAPLRFVTDPCSAVWHMFQRLRSDDQISVGAWVPHMLAPMHPSTKRSLIFLRNPCSDLQ